MTGEGSLVDASNLRLTRGQVLTAWGIGFVASAILTGVLIAADNVAAYGRDAGVSNGLLGIVWAAILGIVPAALVGMPVWFVLARLLQRWRGQWLHVAAFSLAGLALAAAINAVLFIDLLTSLGDFKTLAYLSAPWALGAAIGRIAIIPWIHRAARSPHRPRISAADSANRPREL